SGTQRGRRRVARPHQVVPRLRVGLRLAEQLGGLAQGAGHADRPPALQLRAPYPPGPGRGRVAHGEPPLRQRNPGRQPACFVTLPVSRNTTTADGNGAACRASPKRSRPGRNSTSAAAHHWCHHDVSTLAGTRHTTTSAVVSDDSNAFRTHAPISRP